MPRKNLPSKREEKAKQKNQPVKKTQAKKTVKTAVGTTGMVYSNNFIASPACTYSNLLNTAAFPADNARQLDSTLNTWLNKTINNFFAGADDDIRKMITAQISSVTYTKYINGSLQDIIQATVLNIITDPALKARILRFINGQLDNITVIETLYLDMPLQDNPIFIADLRVARLVIYSGFAVLDTATESNLLTRNIDPAILDDQMLDELLAAKLINADQRIRLGIVMELAKLTDNNTMLMQVLLATNITSTAQLVPLEIADWEKMITDNKIIFPPYETIDSYVQTIYQNIETTYPSQRLFSRLLSTTLLADANLLNSLNPLFLKGIVQIVNGELSYSTTTITAISIQSGIQLNELLAFSNTFRQLKLDAVINDQNMQAADKITDINNRIGLMAAFVKNNPSVDIRYTDFFSTPDGLNWGTVSPDDLVLLRKQLLALQRMMVLSTSTDDRHALMKKGFDSASDIVSLSETEFGLTMGFDPVKTQTIHQQALQNAQTAAHYFQAASDTIRGNFKDIAASNIDPSIVNELQKVDGIRDLFGPQHYCDCEDCRSVLSPAAYFADTMEFIREHISRPVFIKPKHTDSSLYLKNRRPDLWTLPLTCENTNTLIPYLTIVDEVLAAYIGKTVSGNVYEMLSTSYNNDSFKLPFNLPLEEIRIYLSYFGITLFDIYRLLKSDDVFVWHEQLKLSAEQFGIIAGTNPGQGPFKIATLPGSNLVPINDVVNNSLQLNLRGFLNIAGISRQELTDLLASSFDPSLKNVQVENAVLNTGDFNYIPALSNITADVFSYMQRIVRLSKKTKWSLAELDSIFTALAGAGLVSPGTLDDKTIVLTGKLHYIKETLQTDIPLLCTLVGWMPVAVTYPVPPAKIADLGLYEKVFDLSSIFGVADPATGAVNTSAAYHCYAMNTADAADKTIDPATHFLLQGLGIAEADLQQLFVLLKAEMLFDTNGNTTLDRNKLSLLYRHAMLADKLNLSTGDLIAALELLFPAGMTTIQQPDQILQLIDFSKKIVQSGFNAGQIIFITQGQEPAGFSYTATIDSVAAIVIEIAASADPDKLTRFKTELQDAFSVSANMLQYLFAWLNTDTTDQTITAALNTNIADGKVVDLTTLNPLLEIFHALERIQLLLLTTLKFTEEQLAYINTHLSLFGINDSKNLQPGDIFKLAYFYLFISRNNDDSAWAQIQQILSSWQASGIFTSTGTAALAAYWQTDDAILKSVAGSFSAPTAIETIQYYENILAIAVSLGVNAPALLKLGDNSSYAAFQTARNIVLGSFASKYPDNTIRDEKLQPYTDKINVLKRDALCEYIIAKESTFYFKDKSEIYDFFMLDVEMSGCFMTSRLVCAISSLQLYITRVLANLEQSADGSINVLTSMPKDGLKDFKKEWEWRHNYREWQAARKVFLYPENYLEPETLDIKTPVFKELEDELLQGKITMASAEAAYSNYISKFSELAKLKIAGSFYDQDTKTYFLFGRTLHDPGQLYYRTWQNKQQWTAWQFMDLATSSQHVSGIKYLGRIFILWMDIKENKQTDFKDNALMVENISYSYTLNYSYQKEDGKWHVVQKLDYNETDDLLGAFFANLQNVTQEKINYSAQASLAFMDRYRANKIYSDNINGNIIVENYYTPVIDFGTGNVINNRLDLFRNEVHVAAKKTTSTFNEALYLYSNSVIGESYGIKTTESFLAIGPKDAGTLAGIDYRLITNDKTQLTALTQSITDNSVYPYLTLVQGTRDSYYCRLGSQQFLVYGKHAFSGSKRIKKMIRISTSLPDTLGKILFSYGIKQLLSLNTQMKTEKELNIQFTRPKKLHPPYSNTDHLDFDGAYGNYFRELFFHIPFLIASNLNSNHKYSDAKWWYERIFDPGAPESQLDKKPADRNWRYIEFRNAGIEKMKTALTDKAALEQYKKDPFNAHAIARLRAGAYQKAIVMKYIDNLLDWGDQLFATFTMESVNEATMLYMLALDILGKRPKDTGPCNMADEDALSFESLSSAVNSNTDFLINLENWSAGHKNQVDYTQMQVSEYVNGAGAGRLQPQNDDTTFSDLAYAPDTALEAQKQAKPMATYQLSSYKEISDAITETQQVIYKPTVSKRLPDHAITKQASIAFCVPPNDQLLGYWTRVEDRLYKIRHCMNIKGVKKQLALFQPAADAALIAEAAAAGLSLADIDRLLQKPLPPYRFVYIIEKAKQFTQTVQGFGAALLTALEKKDAEQLILMRNLHEKEILHLTTQVKQDGISEASDQELALKAQLINVQNKIDYYSSLIDGGLNPAETIQQNFKLVATGYQTLANQVNLIASVIFLIAEIGSPFSLNYGGKEIGDSTATYSASMSGTAAVADAVASSAAMLATFERREAEWKQQLTIAQQEYKQVEQQVLAAGLKVKIAQREMEIHQRNIVHNQELDDFYKEKFTSLGLYKYLSNTLTRLCRDAYNIAFDMALQAEQVYQFEIDDNNTFIAPDNWQYSRAGLLSGEKLTMQLHRMEKAFMENNLRTYEINQSFSLAMINPVALLQLKQQGICEFNIPEMLFDISYPGQFRRLIKSVRVTIPCVTGPYTNISAKLTLLNSWVRKKDRLDINPLNDAADKMNIATGTAISTSSGQNDGGVFELNFRDERYLPFEGAGAVSSWRLELPALLRTFNYNTISDIVVHISYTAKDDSTFRTTVENNIVNLVGNYASTSGLPRLFSLRYEFPDTFFRLTTSVSNPQTAAFEITQSNFPYMFADKQINLSDIKVYLKNKKGKIIASDNLAIRLNEYTFSSWTGFPANETPDNTLLLAEMGATGSPLKQWIIDAGNGGLKPDEVDDILLLLVYKIG